MSEINLDFVADNLIYGLWRSIDDSYKEKYYTNIWDQFENAIRSASYTGSLKRFLSNIKNKIPMSIQAQYHNDIIKVIDSGEDQKILDWLRNEIAYLVVKVRLLNQERKEKFEDQTK